MWKTEKIEVRKLTNALVNEFVSMTRLPNDRDLRGKRLAFLKDQLEAGRFRTCEWASVQCKEDGNTYRVNGKHTSTLFSQCESMPNVQVIIERYTCDTLAEAADLYSTFDTRESVRSAHDINMAFTASVKELEGVPPRVIDTCVSGMSFAVHEEAYSKETAVDRAERILTDHGFIRWAAHYISAGGRDNKSHMRRGPVAAAMKRTYDADKENASVFWNLVMDESAPQGNPSRKLARYLLLTCIRVPRGKTQQKTAGFREMYVKCLHAWNAWCKDENTNLNYHADAVTPKVETRVKLKEGKIVVKKVG